MNSDDVERSDRGTAIARAVAFLRSRQLPHGEFATLLGADRTMSNPAFDSSPFITSFVLYGLTHVDGIPVADIATKAASFLLSEMEFGGVWRYWSSRQHKHSRLPPDLDDTACISFALKRAGIRPPRNRWAFRCARDSAGRFKTWLFLTGRNRMNPWLLFARSVGFWQARMRNNTAARPDSEDPRFRVMRIDRDDVDPVVNANAVLFLGESPETAAAIQFVIDVVLGKTQARSLYYEDTLALYYAVARAYRHSSPRLSVLAEPIVSQIAARRDKPQPFNPLQAAMAASALLTFAPESSSTEELLRLIASAQRDDGGWSAYPFYNVWGSEELTTGLCLEVLARRSAPARS
jgi:hypothetical protein